MPSLQSRQKKALVEAKRHSVLVQIILRSPIYSVLLTHTLHSHFLGEHFTFGNKCIMRGRTDCAFCEMPAQKQRKKRASL